MKITLELESKDELELYLKGPAALAALDEIYNLARSYLKHVANDSDPTTPLLEQIKQIAGEFT